ncbi:thiamine kinase-like enzyme [Gracilibacillus alcaliphilus]|nr:thiamine kinase-like enzyme [Gracilibacillus alcaliphilus]
MWSESSLKKIAKILRHYHDAVSDFTIDKDWEPIDHTPKPFEVICHNDFALYNIIFQQQKPVGVIDFDVAGPGPKAWDIAYTLYTCVPLSRFYWAETGEAVYYNSLQDADRTKQRILLFLEAYGDSTEQDYIGMVIRRLEGLCRTIQRKAQAGDKQFQKMMDEGHVKHYQCDIEFIHQHRTEWV